MSNMTYHELQLEINRQESKRDRQARSLAQTEKLIESLKALQASGDTKKK